MTKKLFVIAALTILFVGVAWAAAVVGYAYGGPQFQAAYAPADAAVIVMALRSLRSGDTDSAMLLLESHLDTQIIVSD